MGYFVKTENEWICIKYTNRYGSLLCDDMHLQKTGHL